MYLVSYSEGMYDRYRETNLFVTEKKKQQKRM